MTRFFHSQIQPFDERRKVFIGKTEEESIAFSARHFVETAEEALKTKGTFSVALSGGSTPKKIFQKLAKEYRKSLPWDKVLLFWSDERAVSPKDLESNYKMALEAGFSKLPLLAENIFRMKAEKNIEKEARNYEKLILEKLGKSLFDLVMLGMGEDGHTASLFPRTKALEEEKALVVSNYIAEKKTHRMTLTLTAINQSKKIVLYVLGESKAFRVEKVFFSKSQNYPVQKIGTFTTPVLWVLDETSAKSLLSKS